MPLWSEDRLKRTSGVHLFKGPDLSFVNGIQPLFFFCILLLHTLHTRYECICD